MQIVGWILLSLPFIGLFVAVAVIDSVAAAIAIFAASGLTMAIIALGAWLVR